MLLYIFYHIIHMLNKLFPLCIMIIEVNFYRKGGYYMFCNNCGAQLEDQAIFCSECGTKTAQAGGGQAKAQSSPVTPRPRPVPQAAPTPQANPRPVQPAAPTPQANPRPVQPAAPAPQANPRPVQPQQGVVQQAPPTYNQAAAVSPLDAPLGVMSYVGMFLLMSIPLVNFIVMLMWLFGSNVNKNKKNFAIAIVIMTIIGIVIGIVFGGIIAAIFANLMDNVQYQTY